MKKVLNGHNVDTTSLVLDWLRSGQPIRLATLYLIGDPDNPDALWLTDYESPLVWSLWGTFRPSVISRGSVSSKIGLDVTTIDLAWAPRVKSLTSPPTMQTVGAYQKARMGFYDDWPVRIWTAYMPTNGDCDTYGCSELFGGRIGASQIDRGQITFHCNSFLDVINLSVPPHVVELTNTLAANVAATPPPGLSFVPHMTCLAGSTTNAIVAAKESFNFDDDTLHNGFLVFDQGGSTTLGGRWSGIQSNKRVRVPPLNTPEHQDDFTYYVFLLYDAMPWAPTVNDRFYLSGRAPISNSDGSYYGFPYVSSPESAL